MSRHEHRNDVAGTDFSTRTPPDETVELRRGLAQFLDQPLSDHVANGLVTRGGRSASIGSVKYGVYAMFDYDGEPIYVGQSRERVGGRIGRHLTNQRTDAVAMSVLDPFEVYEIEVWLLPEYQDVTDKTDDARKRRAADHLNALERTVFLKLIDDSQFKAILNEKDPPEVPLCALPVSIRGRIVSDEVRRVRRHPDVRIARRAQTIARLAQIIAGRDVKAGLRRALKTQAARLSQIATQRFHALGGEAAVDARSPDDAADEDNG